MGTIPKDNCGIIASVGPGHLSLSSSRDVSVVITTKNSGRTLEKCLQCVFRENPGEVIIVDALSSDSTLSIAKRYGVKLFSDSTGSLAHQRLVGVEAATGTYVMFVDSDVELGSGCITELLQDLEVNSWAGVHAKVFSAENVSYWQRAVHEEFSAFQNAYGPKKQIGTAAALFRRAILMAYPFDPYLKESYEDIDLSRRLIRDGHVIGVSNAVAYHYWKREFSAFVKQRFRGGIGRVRFGVKYRERMLVVLAYPIISAFSRMMRSKGTRRIRLIPYWAVTSSVGFIGVLAGYSKIRHPSQTNQSQMRTPNN